MFIILYFLVGISIAIVMEYYTSYKRGENILLGDALTILFIFVPFWPLWSLYLLLGAFESTRILIKGKKPKT